MTRRRKLKDNELLYQIPLYGLPLANPAVPDYSLTPVKWEHGWAIGVFAVKEPVFVRSPADVAAHLFDTVFRNFMAHDQEELWVLAADTKNYVHHHVLVYKGSLNTTVVRIGEVFKDALRFNAASIIVVHNHPSGAPEPSPEDVRVTEMIIQAGELLSVTVLDHMVIGNGRYVSMKERGLGFK